MAKKNKTKRIRQLVKRHVKKSSAKSKLKRAIRRRAPLRRRLMLHPATAFMMLCAGLLILGATFPSLADSFTINGIVPASPLTEPAVITSPADGTTFNNTPITVSGTCPDNSYVKLSRNNFFSGVSDCVGGAFSIVTDLFVGANSLTAQDYNITDSPGPTSTSITVYYQPAVSPGPSQSSSSSSNSSSGSSTTRTTTQTAKNPFLIESDYLYAAYTAGQPYTIKLQAVGGVMPYALTVAWGDGEQTTIARNNSDTFTVSHTYVSVTSAHFYTIRINGADANGSTDFLQLVAIVNGNTQALAPTASTCNATSATSTNCTAGSFLGQTRQWLWLAWPVYGTLALMGISFWLGERQELRHLLRPRSFQRRRA